MLREERLSGWVYALILLFAAVPCPAFTITGTISDPGLVLFRNLMDEGAMPKGFDRISCRAILVRACDDSGAITEVNPGPTGVFKLTATHTVSSITVESSGGGVYYTIDGQWTGDTSVTIAIDTLQLFSLHGIVCTSGTIAVQHEKVMSLDRNGNVMAYCYTRKNGRYRFWSNRPIEYLSTSLKRQRLRMLGPWNTNTIVDLKEK